LSYPTKFKKYTYDTTLYFKWSDFSIQTLTYLSRGASYTRRRWGQLCVLDFVPQNLAL
jgi:hypothetical protein